LATLEWWFWLVLPGLVVAAGLLLAIVAM